MRNLRKRTRKNVKCSDVITVFGNPKYTRYKRKNKIKKGG